MWAIIFFFFCFLSSCISIAFIHGCVVQELIRKGIPHHFRAIVWQLLGNATDMPVKNQYSELLKMSSPCEKLIRRDIARTYPEHEFFKGQDSLGQEVLFNVMKVKNTSGWDVWPCGRGTTAVFCNQYWCRPTCLYSENMSTIKFAYMLWVDYMLYVPELNNSLTSNGHLQCSRIQISNCQGAICGKRGFILVCRLICFYTYICIVCTVDKFNALEMHIDTLLFHEAWKVEAIKPQLCFHSCCDLTYNAPT